MKRSVLSLFMLIFLISLQGEIQAEKTIKSRIKLNYYKNSDNNITLKAMLTYRKEGKVLPVTNAKVSFYQSTDSTDALLNAAKTDDKGEAIFVISQLSDIQKDTIGSITFITKFDGNNDFKKSTNEVTVKDVRMELSYAVVDSIYKITLTATEIGYNGKETPVNETDVYFYVQRLYGFLKIGEGWMEDGKSSIDFPMGLPGDSVGNIIVVVKIEDNDLYGNVEKREFINWGKRVSYKIKEPERSLFSPYAPMWMVITFIVLMLIVWAHYGYAIFKMCKISQEGSETE